MAPPMQPAPQWSVVPRPPIGLSIWAFVLGLVALPLGVYILGLIPGVLAIIFGSVVAVRARAGRARGAGFGISGIVTGSIAVIIAVVVVSILLVASLSDTPDEDPVLVALGQGTADEPFVALAFDRATQYWSEQGHDVRLVPLGEHSLKVQTVKDWGGRRMDEAMSSSVIQVGLGSSMCNGEWARYDDDTLTLIAIHELGHFLGHENSQDPMDVMYHDFTTTPVGPCTLYEDTVIVEPGTELRRSVHARWGADNATLHYKPSTGRSYQAYEVCLMAPDGRKDCHDGTSESVVWGATEIGPAIGGSYMVEYVCKEAEKNCVYELELVLYDNLRAGNFRPSWQ